jgi:hypothetical protein
MFRFGRVRVWRFAVVSAAAAVSVLGALATSARADLNPVAQGPGQILDANPQRVLFQTESPSAEMKVEENASGNVTIMPRLRGDAPGGAGRLIDGGALFVTTPANHDPQSRLNEWRNGSVTSLGPINSAQSLVTAGDFAIWSAGSLLYERAVSSGATTLVSSTAGSWQNDVATNGGGGSPHATPSGTRRRPLSGRSPSSQRR